MNTMLRISAAALILTVVAGCESTPPAATSNNAASGPQMVRIEGTKLLRVVPAASSASAASASSAASPDVGIAGQTHIYSTQLGSYTLVGFDALPGWQQDDFSASWPAFLKSCQTLAGRGDPWRSICQRALQIDARNGTALRGFFEHEFFPYQIRDGDHQTDGLITGYFEPEIAGSRVYQPPFIYPVYGEPQDMLYLDARKAPAGRDIVAARVQDRQVQVQRGLSTGDLRGPGLYALDLSLILRNTADGKIRLRADGRNLLPYYTREEIETRSVPKAPVLAFVSDAGALYAMQVQGLGRIRLPDGSSIRLSYAEQNGQPFRPVLAKNKPAPRVRGRAAPADSDDGNGATSASVRGMKLALPAKSGAVLVPDMPITGVAGTGISDPRYIFFKAVGGGGDGPMGSLGVPLTPGRSIAVDPRTLPLGYPVFISVPLPGDATPMQRLTLAQDTGSGVRGAVRADYFFGNGAQAAQQARRMWARGQLWLLLPRGQAVAVVGTGAIRPLDGDAQH